MTEFALPADIDDADDAVDELTMTEPIHSVIAELNALVLHPGHRKHQAVVKAIQDAASPTSLSVLRQALDEGFDRYAYTCSEDGVIAKWFSWALFQIGTPEALAIIEEFATSENEEIAEQMQYRLSKPRD